MNSASCFLALGLCLALSNQLSAEEGLGQPFILKALEDAKKVIDDAYKYSREESLSRLQTRSASPADILRLLKQPARDTRSAVRAADYMDYTLTLIQQRAHHLHKRSLNATDLLTPDELSTIARLSGCAARVCPRPCRLIPQVNKYRTATSFCNNLRFPSRGASNTPFTRFLPAQYEDGISKPRGWNPNRRYNGFLLPLVRQVSNEILATTRIDNDRTFTHLLTIFGQWVDHDLTFTPFSPSMRAFSTGVNCEETCKQIEPCFPIPFPRQDPRFNQNSPCLPFIRSAPACRGTSRVREQINALTAFLDAGQVYGSENGLARDLRDFTNTKGLLRVNRRFRDRGRELLPFSRVNPNMCATRRRITNNPGLEEVPCFIAGDTRVDENIGLTSLHTLFLREHNRLARALHRLNPRWGRERLYQEARKIVGAYQQVIVFRKYLKAIVGPGAFCRFLGKYPGYNPNVDPSIANVFATAAYRFAHLAVQPFAFRLDQNYRQTWQFPTVPLPKAFFAPWRLVFEGGIDPLIRGLVGSPAKLNRQNHMLAEALRNKLFQFTSRLAEDLGALNMQRGRDHGIPGYNAWRRLCGLSQPKNCRQLGRVLKNRSLARRLLKLYRTPDNIDVWMGGVAEPFVPGGRVGPLFACLIARQFKRIRQGDRFWWEKEGVFTRRQRASLARTSLARIICDNTGVTKVPRDPFRRTCPISCRRIPTFDLRPWRSKCSDGNSTDCSQFQSENGDFDDQDNEIPLVTLA